MFSNSQKWRLANPEKYAAQRATYRARPEVKESERQRARDCRSANPDKSRNAVKAWRATSGYDPVAANRRRLEKKAQRPKPDSCECCGSGGKICWDHDHATGAFRGWLCEPCNKALGMAHDSLPRLIALVAYLEAHNEPR